MNRIEVTSHADTVFKTDQYPKKFQFNKRIVKVFDDMVSRSVPDYSRILELCERTCRHFYQKNTAVYDLGCSTGNAIKQISKALPKGAKIFGVDSSLEMVEECRKRMKRLALRPSIRILHKDLTEVEIEAASVVILNYTLHFLSVKDRKKLLKRIYRALVPGGVLVVSDKLECKDRTLHSFFIREHQYFKRTQGYTLSEIKRKAESIAGFLVPLTYEKERKLILKAGFRSCDSFFRWAQFCTMIAVK